MNIKDIASLAEVSVSTVSKILNYKDKDISEETRKKVLKVVKDCQYVPYSKIRGSANTRSGILGAILCGDAQENQQLAYYLEQEARKNGYSLLIQFLQNEKERRETEEQCERAFMILEGKMAEGVLFLSPDEEMAVLAEKQELPLVLLKHTRSTALPGVGYEAMQNGYLAAKTLIGQGHRNMGCVLYKDAQGEEIYRGYVSALLQYEISPEPDKVIFVENVQEAGDMAARMLLSANVSGIICQNGEIACTVYDTLHNMGVQIPNELSVIAAEDSKICRLMVPALSAAAISYEKVAVCGVRKLIEQLETPGPLKDPQEMIAPMLKERASVSIPPLGKSGTREKIIVVGSLNMDMVIKVPELPKDGQSLLTQSVQLESGGKGGNQAVGAGKLGGLVYMIGRLGNDNEGREIYNNLIQGSVKTEGIVFDKNAISGRAYIHVSPKGESTIVVHRGANQNLDTDQIRKFRHLFRDARFCLLSLEIPEETAAYTLSICKKQHVQVMLKPATASHIPEKWLPEIDYLIPNEVELHALLPGAESVEEKAEYFYNKGVSNVIVTLGPGGAYVRNSEYQGYMSSMDVQPVDTTGGADSFISALAVALSEGNTLPEAMGFATCAAGISVTRVGVQRALPDRMTMNGYQEEIALLSEIREE